MRGQRLHVGAAARKNGSSGLRVGGIASAHTESRRYAPPTLRFGPSGDTVFASAGEHPRPEGNFRPGGTGRRVADGHGKEALKGFYEQFEEEELERVETVAMDMWRPYIRTTTSRVPQGWAKIAFDKFHIAKHLGEAVDQVRRAEQRRRHDSALKGSRYPVAHQPSEHEPTPLEGVCGVAREYASDGSRLGL